jgi:hypothetical protein
VRRESPLGFAARLTTFAARDKDGTAILARGIVAVGVSCAVLALTPAGAAGAVPRAKWYWSLVVSPSNPNTLLLGTSTGLYCSSDAGKTWHAAGLDGVNATSLVQAGNTIFIGGVRRSPGAKPVVVERGAYISARGPGVLAASTDEGETWQQLHPRGLPSLDVQALAVDPANARALYAVPRAGGVYRSTDGGRSFKLVTPKVGGTPWALAVTQSGHLIAGDMTTGSYLSARGKTWQHTPFIDPQGTFMVMEYAVQPTDLKRILMTSYGVVMSTDSGKSWHVVLKSKAMFGPVAWAPHTTGVAYAVGWDRSVWRSADNGENWTKTS